MIRVRHLTLPAGLSALARRTADGELEIFVSDALDPDGQRAAVRLALRSSRQAGWRAALLPVPLAALLASGRAGLRSVTLAVTRLLRAHAAVSAVAGGLAAAGAAALIIALPHYQHGTASAVKLPSPSRVQAPAPGRTASAPHPASGRRARPGATVAPAGRPEPTVTASGARTAPAAQSAAPAPTPAPSGTTPPAPAPAPSPTSTGGGTCIVLLGIRICL